MKKIILAATAAAMLPLSALADDGFYVGGNVTSTKFSADILSNIGDVANTSVDRKNFGFQLNAGYSFNRYIAIEAFYQGNIEASIDNVVSDGSAEAKTAGIVAIGKFPITSKVDVFAKAGVGRMDMKFKTLGTNESFDGTSTIYGVGVSRKVSEEIIVVGEYTIQKSDLKADDPDFFDWDTKISSFSIGIRYQF